MSRDAFSYHPQDTRDPSPARSVWRRTLAHDREEQKQRDSRGEPAAQLERHTEREPEKPRDADSGTERAYYVRDRTYRSSRFRNPLQEGNRQVPRHRGSGPRQVRLRRGLPANGERDWKVKARFSAI